jgi:pimeloyl-ACP methyl ester carboxylesterase
MAARIAATRPLILGGCSFGGMVAFEMAHSLRPQALVLIGSVAGPRAIPLCLHALSLLSPAIPKMAFRLTQRFIPAMTRVFGIQTADQQALFADMLRDTPAEFLRWACASVSRWKPRTLTGVPIFSIHGTEDYVLPLGGRHVDVVVPGAGHLLPMTNAKEVNEFLLHVKRRATAP